MSVVLLSIMVYMCFACNMSELFSLSVHHGGYFTDNPRKYVGGKVDIVDNCDPDR